MAVREAEPVGSLQEVKDAGLDREDLLGIYRNMLAAPSPDYQSPKTHRETCEAAARWLDNPWVVDGLLVLVDDLDAHHSRAVAAGAAVIRPPEEGPDGRLYTAEDLEGHRWMFNQS